MKRNDAIPAPPEHLSERSRELWRQVVPSRALSAGRLALLAEALTSLDRAGECREALAREGLTVIIEWDNVVDGQD